MFRQKKSYSLEDRDISATYSSPMDRKTPAEVAKKRRPFLGFFYAFATSLLFTVVSVFVKKLSYISPGQLSLVRNAAVFAGCLPLAVYATGEGVAGPRRYRIALVARGFFGATALYLNLTAFRYLPLAEAAIVMSTMPALTTVVARIFLGEACGRVQAASLVATLFGVLLSVRLPELLAVGTRFDREHLAGLASAAGCVAILSGTFVALRKMRDLHFSVPLFYFGLMGVAENGAVQLATGSFEIPQCGWDVAMVMSVGVLGFLGHCSMTLAVQSEAVGVVTVVKASADVVVAVAFQVAFFDASVDAYGVAGACLVTASVAVLGFSKWLAALEDGSEVKGRFRCLLL